MPTSRTAFGGPGCLTADKSRGVGHYSRILRKENDRKIGDESMGDPDRDGKRQIHETKIKTTAFR